MSDTAAARKARGAFFTPPELCRFIADWAIREATDVVLEPSCGDAEFLIAAHHRLAHLGGTTAGELRGAELHAESAAAASVRLAPLGREVDIRVGDFFDAKPTGDAHAVIGNPPYVRYQAHGGTDRAASRAAALRAGVNLSGLASVWAAFTVHATQFLVTGGRAGLVLPAELLSTNYAAPVRRFLMDSFSSVTLVMFHERVFPEVQEEVVLLLGDGFGLGPTDHCTLRQVANVASLSEEAVHTTWTPPDPGGKWTASLLTEDALSVYTTVAGATGWSTLSAWGETSLGAVTGNNSFFTLTDDRVKSLGLGRDEVVRISPPGSTHLRGLRLDVATLRDLDAGGRPTWLFRPGANPSPAARRYIEAGEALQVQDAYKCRVRTPWWQVPVLDPPDLFLTYMNADSPRLCANTSGARHLNSVHGLYASAGKRRLARAVLPLASINSMTLLAAETVGRAYGGGMLKIEPREADVLPVPGPELVQQCRPALDRLREHTGTSLRGDSLAATAAAVDEILLVGELGLSATQVKHLREQQATLMARRKSRSKRGTDGTR
ncbi:MAG: N-6 DNA methylase [Micrococcales bacterium]|nr:N-6 DNA methylase [Micrococcales bacterium]